MDKLRQKLENENRSFNRKVRHIMIIIVAAGLILLAVFIYKFVLGGGRVTSISVPQNVPANELSQPMAFEAEDHPSQLISPIVLYPDRHGAPPIDGATGVDQGIMAQVLKVLQEKTQEELEAMVDRSIEFEDFATEKRREQIRGRVCEVRGTLRRVEKNESGEFSKLGIDFLWEGQIHDRFNRSYTFICLGKPEKLADRQEAVLTGVFYKLTRYKSVGGKRQIDPLIVARTITGGVRYKHHVPATTKLAEKFPPWLTYIAFGVIVVVVLIVMNKILNRPPRKVHRRRSRTSTIGEKPEGAKETMEGDQQEPGENEDPVSEKQQEASSNAAEKSDEVLDEGTGEEGQE
ncbi:MAG: hypothetical protein ACLFWL_05155 [Candidatus Brocadiia bacterium]